MPIFNLRLQVTSVTGLIPVSAASVEDAMAYLHSTAEWQQSSSCHGMFGEGSTFELMAAHLVTHPKQCVIDADDLCWGNDQQEAAEAFYGVTLDFDVWGGEDEDASEAAYKGYYAQLEEAREKFANALIEE